MAQYVYTMNGVGKIVPPKRVILSDISLSFFPGAKIGVLGLNGSGKSSLLRIMGGEERQFDGEARLTDAFGREAVFCDFDSIPQGADFPDLIRTVLADCQVVLTVIGPDWLPILQQRNPPDGGAGPDWVRRELEIACRRVTSLWEAVQGACRTRKTTAR